MPPETDECLLPWERWESLYRTGQIMTKLLSLAVQIVLAFFSVLTVQSRSCEPKKGKVVPRMIQTVVNTGSKDLVLFCVWEPTDGWQWLTQA